MYRKYSTTLIVAEMDSSSFGIKIQTSLELHIRRIVDCKNEKKSQRIKLFLLFLDERQKITAFKSIIKYMKSR
jgi:hypothetical protein